MSDEKNLTDRIEEMAKLSLISNRINPMQEKNLKMYPLVFFNGVKSAVVDYDLTSDSEIDVEDNKKDIDIKYNFKNKKKNDFKVYYKLEIDEAADNGSLESRFSSLENAVRSLFWKEIHVKVFFNGKQVYESKNV